MILAIRSCLYNDSQASERRAKGKEAKSKAWRELSGSLLLALCSLLLSSDEFQTHRLHADSFDVCSRGWFRDHLHRPVSACGPAKTDPHQIDALRVRQGSGRVGTRTFLGKVLPHRDDLHPVRH